MNKTNQPENLKFDTALELDKIDRAVNDRNQKELRNLIQIYKNSNNLKGQKLFRELLLRIYIESRIRELRDPENGWHLKDILHDRYSGKHNYYDTEQLIEEIFTNDELLEEFLFLPGVEYEENIEQINQLFPEE